MPPPSTSCLPVRWSQPCGHYVLCVSLKLESLLPPPPCAGITEAGVVGFRGLVDFVLYRDWVWTVSMQAPQVVSMAPAG